MQELFYLLESQDTEHEGGMVTANSLAIELHAGGLTKEHEVYVRHLQCQLLWDCMSVCSLGR